MIFFHFHDWSKWSSPVNGIFAEHEHGIGYFHVTQMRICEVCGEAQVKKLPKIRRLEDLKNER